MDGRSWVLVAGMLACAFASGLLAVLLVRERRGARRRERDALERLHALEAQLGELARSHQTSGAQQYAEAPDWVITWDDAPQSPPRPVSDRLVLSATLGEPLVKALALGHGVRRALSAESRNRIGFEVRREIRRARKVRRREMRQAWREMRADPTRSAGGAEEVA